MKEICLERFPEWLQLIRLSGQIAGGCSKEKGHKSGMLFALALVLTLGTDRLITYFDFSEWDESYGSKIECR